MLPSRLSKRGRRRSDLPGHRLLLLLHRWLLLLRRCLLMALRLLVVVLLRMLRREEMWRWPLRCQVLFACRRRRGTVRSAETCPKKNTICLSFNGRFSAHVHMIASKYR